LLATLGRTPPVVLDVRRQSEFTGEEARAARGGRIPGARHLEWRDALGPDWTMRPAEEVRAAFAARGVTPDVPVVTYCQVGVRAAMSAFVLHALGFGDVRVYDGSWEEWGNDPALPIETG
jgi:thiosulfate/3-mercaptopyruvate sulfurtransferase